MNDPALDRWLLLAHMILTAAIVAVIVLAVYFVRGFFSAWREDRRRKFEPPAEDAFSVVAGRAGQFYVIDDSRGAVVFESPSKEVAMLKRRDLALAHYREQRARRPESVREWFGRAWGRVAPERR